MNWAIGISIILICIALLIQKSLSTWGSEITSQVIAAVLSNGLRKVQVCLQKLILYINIAYSGEQREIELIAKTALGEQVLEKL